MIPGSALRKLAKITGLKATREADSCWKLEVCPGVAHFSFLSDEQAACAELRAINWKRVVRAVCTAQGWRCHKCQAMTPLSGHHRIFRSRWRPTDGPLDVESNIWGLCSACHESQHRG